MERIRAVAGARRPQAHARPAVIEKLDSRGLKRRYNGFHRIALAGDGLGSAILHRNDRLDGDVGAFRQHGLFHSDERPRCAQLISTDRHFAPEP
jgi:hypothetical protein